MAVKGEIFVRIDDAQMQAILAQLQASGGGGGAVGGGVVAPTGGGAAAPTVGGYMIGPPKLKAKISGIDVKGVAGDIPTVPRPLRTALGAAIPGAYGAVMEYNMVRWGMRGLDAYEATRAAGGGLRGFLTSGNLSLMLAGPIFMAVQLMHLYEQMQSQREQMQKDIERMAGITGQTYDRWLKIQSNPLMRRNIG